MVVSNSMPIMTIKDLRNAICDIPDTVPVYCAGDSCALEVHDNLDNNQICEVNFDCAGSFIDYDEQFSMIELYPSKLIN